MTATAILDPFKLCIQCGARDRIPSGQCRVCSKANAKRWAAKNVEYIKARNKAKYEATKNSANCGIYAIRNTITGQAYVGQSKTLTSRKRQHFSDLRWGSHFSSSLQQDFHTLGESCFEFTVLELCEEIVLTQREQHWIDAAKETGIYNLSPTAGSPLGVVRSAETRAKIGAATIGRVHSEETLSKMRNSQAAIQDLKRANSIKQFAKPGAKEKMSAIKMGTVTSDETKTKLAVTSKSMWQAEGHKEKLAAIHKARWADPEFRAKMAVNKLIKQQAKQSSLI